MIYLIDDSKLEDFNADYVFDDKYKNILTIVRNMSEFSKVLDMLSNACCIMVHNTFCGSQQVKNKCSRVACNGEKIPFIVFSAGDSENAVVSSTTNAIISLRKGVFYNRLKHPEKGFATLGSDPTMVYPNKKEQDDRYNTYKCTGLPIGPICSPSIDSIKAAVYPKENWDYYYFVTDKSSQFYFNKTLNEHNSTIAKLKREGKWLS